jgi:hypothetical protein
MAYDISITPQGQENKSAFQRPTCEVTDPRGGFQFNPEFRIYGAIDNGAWSSTKGNLSDPFTKP